MVLLTESQYFPPVTLFKKVVQFSNIEFDIYEVYQKMSFRNRCVVAGANGPIILSVPLEDGRNQRKPFKEVRIANRSRWQEQHWRTITSCYNRSPWFDFYRDELADLYGQSFEFLIDWNMTCWNWVVPRLGIELSTRFTDSFKASYDKEKYEDWRSRLIPKSIDSDFPDPVKYRQVFEEKLGFIPHLSILDLLFCEGKNAATRVLSLSMH
jgi:hypothetical protein